MPNLTLAQLNTTYLIKYNWNSARTYDRHKVKTNVNFKLSSFSFYICMTFQYPNDPNSTT